MSEFSPAPLRLQDKPMFDSAYSELKFPLSDQCFEMLFIWKDVINLQWAGVEDGFCLFADFAGSKVLWGPVMVSQARLSAALKACFAYLDGINTGRSALLYLPEELAGAYSSAGFGVVSQSQEYLYRPSDLVSLAGHAFRKKRNLVNAFLSAHRPVVEEFSSRHSASALRLLQRWQQEKESVVDDSVLFQLRLEAEIARSAISLAEAIGLKGMAVLLDGELQAFTFGYEVTPSMCCAMVEKTNLSFRGLPEFVFTEFVKRFWQSYQWVNVQEDMGVDYLKRAKMAWHPAKLIRSYSVYRRQ